jgi:HD-like signal output (HDOD) protein
MTEVAARPEAPWALRLVPPFPVVASRLLSLVCQADPSLKEVGDLVRMDPSFSAEILRFANSALFGARGEVKSVAHATLMVGLERVKTMATLVAVSRMIRASVRLQALRKVWLHSLVTAHITEEIARVCHIAREGSYTLGLLHNLGTLGLMSAYPAEYSHMLEVSDDFGFDLLATERELFEIDHCAAGAYLAHDWGFPDEMATVIATHHEAPNPGEASLSNYLRVAWRLADTFGFAAFSPDRQWDYEELMEFLPNAGLSWLGNPASAKDAIEASLAVLPD